MTAQTPNTTRTPTSVANTFERETFTTSRLLDFCSEKELTAQTGHPRNEWPLVIFKELVDNALDASEDAGIAPVVTVKVDANGIEVADNGPGIPASTIKGAIDFGNRTSSCSAYVGLTRGAQGNALQTILMMPYVVSGDAGQGHTIVEARGLRHTIEITVDLVQQQPVVSYDESPSERRTGTSVLVQWPLSPRSQDGGENPLKAIFLQLAGAFAFCNPHLTLKVDWFGEETEWSATNLRWRKWRPSDPSSPHWYTPETLKTLIAACLRKDRDNETSRFVRDLVESFHGLSGTAKQKQVLAATGLAKAPLSRLVNDDGFDLRLVTNLLAEMRTASRPVQPSALGVLGKEHISQRLADAGCDMSSFEYRKVQLTDDANGADLPTVIEVAFAYNGDDGDSAGRLITGTKWSAAIRNPFRKLGGHGSLDSILSDQFADVDEPVTVFVHVAQPLSSFTDRGKSAVVVPDATADAIVEAVTLVTKRWEKQRKREEKEWAAGERRAVAAARRRRGGIDQKAAAWMVMEEAYMKASANGTLPALARQIMYAARPRILQLSGKNRLDDKYFTQTLLPDYIAENGCAHWNVVYDARGHFHEPHTTREVPLGTLDVREYLEVADGHVIGLPNYDVRERLYPTFGPQHRYSAVLFIEKEGFMPLFEAVRLKERYDLAIMSTKGMSTTASRKLVDQLCSAYDIPLLVVHDFDKSGFSIAGTLMRNNRRHTFENEITGIDVGLRMGDIAGLEHESSGINPKHHAAVVANLTENGATADEIEFLLHHRVELNAFTSDQLVAWLERKLDEHGIKKVIPDEETLAAAYQRARETADVQRLIDEAIRRRRARPPQIIIPADLRARVEKALNEDRGRPWDEVVSEMVLQADSVSPR